MGTPDPLLERVSPALATVPGVVSVVLGGSRAAGSAHAASDYDIGLYFSERAGLDAKRLLEAAKDPVQHRERADRIARDDRTYIAGCAFRSLACAAQVLFALNRNYLINEKGAVAAAARLPLTADNLAERVSSIWQAVGLCAFDAALGELMSIHRELAGLSEAAH